MIVYIIWEEDRKSTPDMIPCLCKDLEVEDSQGYEGFVIVARNHASMSCSPHYRA